MRHAVSPNPTLDGRQARKHRFVPQTDVALPVVLVHLVLHRLVGERQCSWIVDVEGANLAVDHIATLKPSIAKAAVFRLVLDGAQKPVFAASMKLDVAGQDQLVVDVRKYCGRRGSLEGGEEGDAGHVRQPILEVLRQCRMQRRPFVKPRKILHDVGARHDDDAHDAYTVPPCRLMRVREGVLDSSSDLARSNCLPPVDAEHVIVLVHKVSVKSSTDATVRHLDAALVDHPRIRQPYAIVDRMVTISRDPFLFKLRRVRVEDEEWGHVPLGDLAVVVGHPVDVLGRHLKPIPED